MFSYPVSKGSAGLAKHGRNVYRQKARRKSNKHAAVTNATNTGLQGRNERLCRHQQLSGCAVKPVMSMATCIAAEVLLVILVFHVRHCFGTHEHYPARHHEQHQSQPMRTFLPQWMAHTNLLHQRLIHKQDSSPYTSKQGQYHGQDAEDRAAELKYFHNLHKGVFLEMGALDGVLFSNTKHFEDAKDWRGILIEPNSVEFEKLSGNRPNAISVNAAVCAQKQTVHFVGERLQTSAGNYLPLVRYSCRRDLSARAFAWQHAFFRLEMLPCRHCWRHLGEH